MRHSIAAPRRVTLGLIESERLPGRDAHHLAHQIEPGDELGDRMLDLEPRVHLQEVEALVLAQQKLERPRREVADRFRALHRDFAHPPHDRLVDRRARRLFDDLLVPALDRAVALEQVHHVAVAIAEHLDLDVARSQNRLLDVDRFVAEGLLRLAPRALEGARELVLLVHEAHALAAAAGRGLEHHRVADARSRRLGLFHGVGVAARHDRNARFRHLRARSGLRTHRAHRARRRPDERDARALASLGEQRVLRQESVPGMKPVAPRALHHVDQAVDAQVALGSGRGTDRISLVGEPHVQRFAISFAVHRDGRDPHLVQRARDAHRNLAAVGDQHLFQHDARSHTTRRDLPASSLSKALGLWAGETRPARAPSVNRAKTRSDRRR